MVLGAQAGQQLLVGVTITRSSAFHVTPLVYLGLPRICEHVTPSVSLAGQGKTDQVQTFPRERELASGVGYSRPREKGVKSQAGPQRQ